MKAAQELDYRPNVLASSLTTGRTKLVGLISDNFSNPYFLEVFDLFTRALQKAGLRTLLLNFRDAEDASRSLDLLRQYNVDAVIVASSTLPGSFSAAFRDAGLPLVHAFGWSSETDACGLVGIDNVACGRLVAQSLIDRGYLDIAFLGGPARARTTQDRLQGFLDAAQTAGVTPRHFFAEDYAFEAGRDAMTRHLQTAPAAAAYGCGDDVIAMGALSALQDAGLAVPRDVGVMGINDMAMAGWPNIALTTIRQPAAEIVAATVEMIEQGIASQSALATSRLFPCTLIDRTTLRAR